MRHYTKPSEAFAEGYAIPGYHIDNDMKCWCFKDERILLPDGAVPVEYVIFGSRDKLPVAKIEDVRKKAVQ